MISEHNFAVIKDINDQKEISFEVNFDKKHPEYIRVKIGTDTVKIDRQKLWDFVFAIVKPDMQLQMIPKLKTEMERYYKQHSVELQKDMKKGEKLLVNCEVNVKQEVADAYRREIEESNIAKLSPFLAQNN